MKIEAIRLKVLGLWILAAMLIAGTVALEDGVPLGAATVQLGNELYKLYVAPQHRGRHVAEKLVSHVMDFLKEEGETEISIEMTKNSLPFWGRVVEKHSLEYEPIYGQLKMLIKLK